MLLPTPRLLAGLAGLQVTLAPAGRPPGTQLALAAMLGPLLVQVTVPVTVLSDDGLLGKPPTAATMSACGTIVIGMVSTLLAGVGSAVVLPAVVVMLKEPLAGAIKVLVQVMALPAARLRGSGLGLQLCVAPAGRPLIAQLGLVAALKPVLAQLPDTVTLSPAFTLAGTVVAATMSAWGATLVETCTLLLAVSGSAMLLPAVPVMVMPPLPGTL